jgi:LAO/AO transport system kinase
VVTKADLGDVAMRARRDLQAALRSLGVRDTPVVSVSSLPPPAGIDELVDALDAHRAGLDVAATRLRSRRLAALADFTAEYGERALRALGGRRAAEKLLAEEDPSLSVAELAARLESAAAGTG